LPHEQVAESQRERLIAAMTDLAHERGYCETTVTDVLQRASVSRASFYQLFDNREHCALVAFDTHVARLQAEVISAYRNPDLDSDQRLRAALDHLFQVIISWPAAARLWSSEISTVSPAGLERRERIASTTAAALARVLADGSDVAPTLTAARMMVGAAIHLIYTRVRDGLELELPATATAFIDWMRRCQSAALSSPSRPRVALPSAGVTARIARTSAEEGSRQQAAIRLRIIAAVGELADKRGYQAMTYRDIAAGAQISLTTFYNNFANKQEAFLAAFGGASDRLIGAVTRAFNAAPDPARGLRDAVTALLDEASSDQAAMRLACLQLPLTGRAGLQRLDEVLQAAQQALAGRPSQDYARGAACELAVGAMSELLISSTITGRLDELPRQAPELSYVVLCVLVGPDVALEVTTEPV
jgi:AcrR family transcriptional regulator